MIDKLKNVLSLRAIISIAGIVLLLLSVFLGVYLVRQRTQLKSRAAADTSIFSFVPSSANANLNQELSFNVIFNRGTGARPPAITGVDLRISTDNSSIQIIRFTPDTSANKFNTELRNEIAPDGLSLRYIAINTGDTSNLPTNQVVSLGTLTVKAISGGSPNIKFDTSTQAVASGYKDAVPLDLIRVAAVTVVGPTTPLCDTCGTGTIDVCTTSIACGTNLSGTCTKTTLSTGGTCTSVASASCTVASKTCSTGYTCSTTGTCTPSVTPPVTSCSVSGDIDGNGRIEMADFDKWKNAFVNGNSIINVLPALNNCADVPVDLILFNTWRSQFARQ